MLFLSSIVLKLKWYHRVQLNHYNAIWFQKASVLWTARGARLGRNHFSAVPSRMFWTAAKIRSSQGEGMVC